MHVLYNTLIELYSFLSKLTDMCRDSQSCLCKILHTDPVQSLMSNCNWPFVQRLVSVVCSGVLLISIQPPQQSLHSLLHAASSLQKD